MRHNGFAIIDVISPCVSFNDHETSTKSYRYTRNHYNEIAPVDFVPLRREITAEVVDKSLVTVMMHDGSTVRFRKVDSEYDPKDRDAAYAYVRARQGHGEVVTGLLYIDETAADMHAVSGTIDRPLVDLPYADLCPGSGALAELMAEYR
jgi:2-oxoglutarate ferredoxin oxidoreductase subunit beta